MIVGRSISWAVGLIPAALWVVHFAWEGLRAHPLRTPSRSWEW
ncbi:hypothetical protein [Candidatus Manganitrophus noduliformans]|nr:hypothetical protein [Candidatus Manganitrophus noduliformans]